MDLKGSLFFRYLFPYIYIYPPSRFPIKDVSWHAIIIIVTLKWEKFSRWGAARGQSEKRKKKGRGKRGKSLFSRIFHRLFFLNKKKKDMLNVNFSGVSGQCLKGQRLIRKRTNMNERTNDNLNGCKIRTRNFERFDFFVTLRF